MLKIIYFVFAVILLIMNLFLIYIHYNCGSELNIQKANFNKIIEELHEEKNNLQNQITDQLLSEGFSLSKSFLLSDGINNISIEKAINDSTKFIFRFNEMNCHICADVQLEALKEFSKKIGNNRIIIIAGYSNIRNFLLFKQSNQIKSIVYNAEFLNIPAEKLNVPYFFVLDKNLKVNFLFLPKKEFPILTEKYLGKIQQVFSSIGY